MNKNKLKNTIDDSDDEFLEITEGELNLITDLREVLLKHYGGIVMGDITDIAPNELVVRFDIKILNKEDILTINRETLTWTY